MKDGAVTMETCLEIDRYNRFPLQHDKWEVRKETKTYRYKLQTVRSGQCFGQEEILTNLKKRTSRVVALTNCSIVTFRKNM